MGNFAHGREERHGGNGEGGAANSPQGLCNRGITCAGSVENHPEDHDHDAHQNGRVDQQQKIDQTTIDLPFGHRLRVRPGILLINMVIVLGFNVGNVGEEKHQGENHDQHGHPGIRNPERLTARAFPGGVLGIEEQAAGNRPKHPADAVARLREIDARGRVLLWTQHRCVGVGDGFKKREARRYQTNPQQKRPKGRKVRRRDKPKAAASD